MDEVAQLVQRLSDDLSVKLKIVGQEKDFIISPNLSRGWEAPDKSFGDNMHNSFGQCWSGLQNPTRATVRWHRTVSLLILRGLK